MKTYRKETFLISICTFFLFVFVFLSIGNATQTDVPETTGSVETTSTGETSDGQTTTTLSITGGTTSVFTPLSIDFGELEVSSSQQEKNIELEAPNYFGIEDLKGQGGYYTTLQIGELSDGDKTLEVTEAKVKIPNLEVHTIAGQEGSNISVPDSASDFILFDSENPANILERVVTTNGRIGKYGVLPDIKLTIAAYQQVGDYEGTITFTIIEDGSISPIVYASCKELLDNDSSLTSGVYTINPSGSEEFEVYCDMETEGGGWTLLLGAGTQFDKDSEFWDGTLNSSSIYYYNTFSGNSRNSEVLIKDLSFKKLLVDFGGGGSLAVPIPRDNPTIFESSENSTFAVKKANITSWTQVSGDNSLGNMEWNVNDRDGYTYADFLLAFTTAPDFVYGDNLRFGLGIKGYASPQGSYFGTLGRFNNLNLNSETAILCNSNIVQPCVVEKCENTRFCNPSNNKNHLISVGVVSHREVIDVMDVSGEVKDLGIFIK